MAKSNKLDDITSVDLQLKSLGWMVIIDSGLVVWQYKCDRIDK